LSAHEHPNQFALLRQRRFAPFFWTQFLGAGNDNLFKFAFTVMITYQLQVSWLPPELAGLVIGALFILPFLLFSATSGQLADKFDKARLIRFVKWLEIAIMASEGMTNKAIAERLSVSVRTVEGHIYRACMKLDVPDRTMLAEVVASTKTSSGLRKPSSRSPSTL